MSHSGAVGEAWALLLLRRESGTHQQAAITLLFMGLLQRCLAPEGGKQKEKLSVWQLFPGEPIEKVLSQYEMCL